MIVLALQLVATVVILVVLGLVVYFAIPFRRPYPSESDYSHHRSPWWQLNYSHKYLHPRLRAEKGSGLEEHFRRQSLVFDDEPLRGSRTFDLTAVGDLMCRPDLLGPGGEHLYDEVGPEVFDADLRTGNLELAINEDRFILKTIRYSVPPSWTEPLLGDDRFGRFDFVSLGNNHINDSLAPGIRRTCDHLDSIGLLHAGANRSAEEQDRITLFEVAGVKLALLAYSFSSNGIPLDPEAPWGLNLVRFNALSEADYDDSLIRRHIALAKEAGADYIVCHNHWGNDHELYPPARLVERAHRLMDAGVDLILGHHSHLVGPVERYRSSDGRDCLCFYSLGSLTTFALLFPLNRLSQIARIRLEAGEDSEGRTVVRPRKVILTPVYHSIAQREGRPDNRLIPVYPAAEAIGAGRTPPHYTRSDARVIPRLARIYREHLTFEGVEYR